MNHGTENASLAHIARKVWLERGSPAVTRSRIALIASASCLQRGATLATSPSQVYRHWHNDCFFCASCRTSLVGRGFITDQEDIICPECAKQKLS
nr:unnamed protein product [Callosobruchus analis]